MINDQADEVIKELFESHKKGFQNNLEGSMKGSEFVFNYVHLLYHKYKINLNCGASYTDSLDWTKNKKSNNKSRQ